MSVQTLANDLRRVLPGLRLLEDEPMKHHCSFRIGGPAALFAEPSSAEELAALRRLLWEQGVEPVVIGNGTNLLVADAGIPGVVIHLSDTLGAVRVDGETLYAESGILLSRLAVAAKEQGLSGLEFAHGIPGSLGGAVLMNAGAYGGEVKDVVGSVYCLDEHGNVWDTDNPGFSYRHSRFTGSGDIVLGARLRLLPGDRETISARMRELMEKRSASQPLNKPSAGSTFKRPASGYAAAMIDGAGLKGFTIGGAQVSEKHAGFVINTGSATCADVLALMDHIRETVLQKYGVLLEPEVKLIG